MDSVTRHILDLSRRGLLRGATAMAALAATRPAFAQRVAPMPVFRTDPFPLGVASGDPWPDGVVIWTQLSQDPLGDGGLPPEALELGWEVAEDEGFTRIAARGTALARPELNHSVRVEVTGLRPAARYHYRFHAGGVASPVGRTRTAPAPVARPARMRFISAGCQHYEQGLYTAWRHAATEEDIDFVFHYGDYIYEGRANTGRSGNFPAIRSHNSPPVETLEAYRRRYALYQLDPDLRAAHHAHPFITSFDDHEVENNWAGAISARAGIGPEVLALRKAAAFQAWYEAMPVRRGQIPRGPEVTAWRGIAWGTLASISVLDTRSHRDDQPCGDFVKPVCEAVLNPAAQVLGPEQESWLFRRLAGAEAVWSILAQQVPVMRRDVGGANGDETPRYDMDKWDAYPAARARLLNHVWEARVANLVVLTGDVHTAWAGTLRPDYDREGPALGVEFIASSISSAGDGGETSATGQRALERNPHIRFFNARRGYTLHQADERRMQTWFRAVPYVSRPGAPLEDRAHFVVEAGRPELIPA
ncbi:alkaline phosphatase D family protein [Roseomonas sp. SSH11]|uniref:Alkaline phosphatase D family protein n=1 Tax=Pararoseomonas baculiformis TaxID=2820812 RepID=A0ABS4AD00_9PROT|nr:alkaline phosphatase D family protein [Pararoseomonas baculiformis]MBP0444890.1 alkaline phosphatase D family protein [Pararoseomonas baculiformis]